MASTTKEQVLAKAVIRAAGRLGLSQKELGHALGVSAASVSRLYAGARCLSPADGEGERALLLLRIFRSLDSLLGGEQEKVAAWFQAENQHLGGVPAKLAQDLRGLVHVADYLDAMRGTY